MNKPIFFKLLKIIIFILKVLFSIILCYITIILTLFGYTESKITINPYLVLLFLIFIIIFINWAIWQKGLLKKIFMLVVLFIIAVNATIYLMDYMGLESDYCIEDGYCEEGRVVNTQHGTITINEENCIKYGWEWDEKRKMCKVS
ncbi:MAG: hypothetical protein BHW64_03165 [Candidatus Melainabacteria bacterium LEY3_CP_29_8]|nr:MAG: hypothetical protein BHW64_03165 [Candidatus Melainabacteria bacterium LEY3_CP_29_8]